MLVCIINHAIRYRLQIRWLRNDCAFVGYILLKKQIKIALLVENAINHVFIQ